MGNRAVSFWDERPLPTEFPWLPIHDVIWQAAGQKPIDILDLAAGPGRFSVPLLQQGCRVTAVELGPKLARHLGSLRGSGGGTMVVVEQDVRACHFPPASFDLIICSQILHFLSLTEAQELLAQCRDWLRPGGLLLLRWFAPGGELSFRFDRFVVSAGDMLSRMDGGRVLMESVQELPTAEKRADGSLKTHQVVEMIIAF